MASAILFAGVLAVISALMGGQRQALEAHRQMDAALAAEELMGQVAALDYSMLSFAAGTTSAGPFEAEVTLAAEEHDLPGLGVRIRGTQMHIRIPPSYTSDPLLAELTLFIPEPQP